MVAKVFGEGGRFLKAKKLGEGDRVL